MPEQKKATYKACFDQQCQIELGRELAAEKTLDTQIGKLGDQCLVATKLFDLQKATTELAAKAGGSCDEAGLLRSIDQVTEKLVGQPPSFKS